MDDFARDRIAGFKIVAQGPNQVVNNLSGGNQQKVLLSAWFGIQPDFLIVDEPTRGVDVGAKSDIYRLLRTLAAEGIAAEVVDLRTLRPWDKQTVRDCVSRTHRAVVVEPPWTATALMQAVKRVHRIGQDAACMAEVLIAPDCWLEDVMGGVVGVKRRAAAELLDLLTSRE